MNSQDRFNIELLVEQLLDAEDGELVTFSRLSALTGLDIQFEHRSLLQRALEIVLDEHKTVYENVRNVGYVRMSDPEVIKSLKAIRHVRKTTEREIKKLSTTNFEALDDAVKPRHNAKFAWLIAVGNISNERAVQKLENKISDEISKINIQEIVAKLFLGTVDLDDETKPPKSGETK